MKRVLLVIMCIMLLVGCGKKEKEEGISGMITIDINPSIEMEVQDNNANRINPLDNEAREIVDRDSMEGRPLGEVLESIISKVKEKGYAENNEMVIILGMEDKNSKVEELLKAACEKSKIKASIVVPEITEEAKHEAEGYDVTPAKAAVILEAIKGNEELHFDDLKDKSARELVQIKDTGKYCDREYTLNSEGKCEKRVRDEDPKEGKSCPSGYQEVKDKCYKVGESDLEAYCKSGSLKRNKCITYKTVAAQPSKYSCSKGTAKTKFESGLSNKNDGDANDIVCVDTSNATHPVSPCELNDGTEWTKSGGKCYWHRVDKMSSGCPGKIEVNGECWDDASNVLICKGERDGKQYKSRDEYCEKTVKYTNPTVSEYKCSEGTLSGTKCKVEVENDPDYRVTCSEGFTNYQDKVCLDYNNSKDFVVGLSCEKDARLEGKRCVYYEVIDAKSK